MRVLATVLFATALTTGCVSKGKYGELENQYNTAVSERDAAQAERDQAKNDLQEVKERNRKRLESFAKVYEDLLKVEGSNLAKVKIEDGRAVLELDSDVLFASGSAQLTPAGVTAVQDIAKTLAAGTENAKFQVEGHTDNDPIKNSKEFPTNWHLGADRSINVVSEMIKAGFPADRLSAATLADTRPVGDNSTPEAKKANRRIEIVWMPDLIEMLPFKKMMKEIKQEAKADTEAAPAPAPQ
jgi:chemotaxis protein MotB